MSEKPLWRERCINLNGDGWLRQKIPQIHSYLLSFGALYRDETEPHKTQQRRLLLKFTHTYFVMSIKSVKLETCGAALHMFYWLFSVNIFKHAGRSPHCCWWKWTTINFLINFFLRRRIYWAVFFESIYFKFKSWKEFFLYLVRTSSSWMNKYFLNITSKQLIHYHILESSLSLLLMKALREEKSQTKNSLRLTITISWILSVCLRMVKFIFHHYVLVVNILSHYTNGLSDQRGIVVIPQNFPSLIPLSHRHAIPANIYTITKINTLMVMSFLIKRISQQLITRHAYRLCHDHHKTNYEMCFPLFEPNLISC